MTYFRAVARAAAGGVATAALAATIMTASGSVAAAAPTEPAQPLTPIPALSQSSVYRVNPILNVDDFLYTDKDFVLGPGEVRATSVDGRTFHYFRVVGNARAPMVRTAPVCIPGGHCHALIMDDAAPTI